MGSLLHADSMEIAATAKSICFTNRRGFTMNLQITQVITIGIIQGKPALLTSILLRLAMYRTWLAYFTGCLLQLRRPIRDNPSGTCASPPSLRNPVRYVGWRAAERRSHQQRSEMFRLYTGDD